MNVRYTFEDETKNYARFVPGKREPVVGKLYIDLDEWEALGKPTELTVTISLISAVAAA